MAIQGAWRRVRATASGALGLYELPEGNRRFLLAHLNFILFTTIPGVFINTFFFRQDGRISTVVIYNAICCFGSAIFMQMSSYIAIRKSPLLVLRVGIVLFNLFYFTLLTLQGHAVHFMPLLGVLNAMASGFYWQGYNILLRVFTDDDNFNRTLSLIGVSNAAVSFLVPMLSGFVITRLGSRLGYSAVFVLSFSFAVYTAYLSTRIPSVRIQVKPRLAFTYQQIFRIRSWRQIFYSEFFRGIRDQAFPLFLSIIFFKLIENESILGINTMVCSVAAVASFYLSTRIIRSDNWIRCIFVSTAVLTGVYLIMFWHFSAWILFFLSVCNSLLVTYISNPWIGAFYSKYKDLPEDINFSQLMAAHEIFFALGRVVGFGLMILLTLSSRLYPFALLVLNLSSFVGLGFLHTALKERREEG